jgi:hypothetical protein
MAVDPSLPSSPVSRYFPLVEGPIWAYDAASDDDPAKKGMFVTRVRRLAGARFSFVSGNGEHTLEARSDGILQTESGTYLLKAPLTVGASWPGEHGVVRVAALDQAVEVPAGKFVGCVETAEESASATGAGTTAEKSGGAQATPEQRISITYCPDVGIAVLHIEAWERGQHRGERATLRSFGKPVDLAK